MSVVHNSSPRARPSVVGRFRTLWTYRELLVGMVRKDLRVRYKGTTLGFLWSMLNPLLYLGVFYVVFQLILGAGIPQFPVFLLSGLLVWNVISNGISAATGSITGNQSLVNKVWFPREILPLASVGATLVHFFLQGAVLVGVLIVIRYDIAWSYLWLVVPAFVVLVTLTSALAVLLSAANVYLRDTQHLLELVLLAWFWLTPIVYQPRLQSDLVATRSWMPDWSWLLNPATPLVLTFQRAIYGQVEVEAVGNVDPARPTVIVMNGILPAGVDQWWYLRNLAILGATSVVLLAVALAVFGRVEGDFAEEL
ncbi:MAG: ABC transporter permease [Actinomycetia bacterium]|nr:ABC transporter permease [Actinomycetes bacterium]MCP5026766.1 ABC transporter permease [Actinomycetes bacterium]